MRTVRDVVIFDTYVSLSADEHCTMVCSTKGSEKDSHPSMPPLPVTRSRSLQSSGSHSSNDTLDLFDVGIESPTRQIPTATSILGRAHVGSLSGRVRFVPAGT